MPIKVPPVDPDLGGSEDRERREELEFELLEAEAKLKQLANREIGQSFAIKWIASGTGLFVIVGMAALSTHFLHKAFWGPFLLVSPSFGSSNDRGPGRVYHCNYGRDLCWRVQPTRRKWHRKTWERRFHWRRFIQRHVTL